jgi:hypothetical protein
VKIWFYFSKNSELNVKKLNKIGKTGPIIIQNATIIMLWKAANLTVDVRRESHKGVVGIRGIVCKQWNSLAVSCCFGFCGYYRRDPLLVDGW